VFRRRRPLSLLCLAVAACETPPPPPPPPAAPPLAFDFAGCAQVLAGPVCVLTPGESRVRLRAVDSAACALVAEGRMPASAAAGSPLVLDVEPETVAAGALSLRCGEHRGSLALATGAPPPVVFSEIRGRPASFALAVLAEALPKADPGEASRLWFERARAENRSGRVAEARASLGRSVELAAASGQLDVAVRARLLRAFLAITTRDFPAADADIEAARTSAGPWAEGRLLAAFHAAVLARESGAYREADEALEDADALARIFLPSFRDAVANERAALGQALGRPEEVIAGLSAALGPERTDCAAVPMLGNLAWAQLRLREVSPAAAPDPEPTLLRLRALEEPCQQPPTYRQATRLNLAFAALLSGRLDAASTALTEAAALPEDLESARWRLDLVGRLALSRGRHIEARAAYARLLALGQAAGEPEVIWRAHDGLARVARDARRPDAAIEAWRAAEAVLDTAVARVPVDAGRQRFLGTFESSARALVDALVARGALDEAAKVARWARRRALAAAALQARLARSNGPAFEAFRTALEAWRARRRALEESAAADWRLTATELDLARGRRARDLAALERDLSALLDRLSGPVGAPVELPPPPGGAAEVTWFPGETGFYAFVRRADAPGTQVFRLGPAPATGGAPWALAPVAAALDGVSRLRVLAHGPVRALDLHAASVGPGNEPAVARWTFEYPLDLSPAAADAPSAPLRVGLVADPRGDLAAAAREAGLVEARLRARGIELADALRGEQATGSALRRLLSSVDVLHYAGHGVFSGRDGFEGALRLAGEDRLTVGDVLLLPRVPGRLVLSACEAARTAAGPGEGAEGLGIAQAFVLAGAGQVVAATRPVRDAAAARLMDVLHGGAAGPEFDLVRALAEAQRAAAQGGADDDWAAFRVVVP
jgi:tetratricopeptide (TPR) repeat protein